MIIPLMAMTPPAVGNVTRTQNEICWHGGGKTYKSGQKGKAKRSTHQHKTPSLMSAQHWPRPAQPHTPV